MLGPTVAALEDSVFEAVSPFGSEPAAETLGNIPSAMSCSRRDPAEAEAGAWSDSLDLVTRAFRTLSMMFAFGLAAGPTKGHPCIAATAS